MSQAHDFVVPSGGVPPQERITGEKAFEQGTTTITATTHTDTPQDKAKNKTTDPDHEKPKESYSHHGNEHEHPESARNYTTTTTTSTTHDAEKGLPKEQKTGELYSTFPRHAKFLILVMSTLGGFFSPFSTSIYFPALTPLASHFNVSTNLINLTITTYMIFQGISPMLYADFADEAGRRPAFFATFVVYMIANIGLALQNSYPALLVLRCLQSAGSSGTVALGRGMIADIATPAERGSYMGWSSSVMILGPAIAPIFGGLLTQHLGWRSIFWLLVIMSGVYTIIFLLFVPETNRKIVGNGSIAPTSKLNQSGWSIITRTLHRRRDTTKDTPEPQATTTLPKRKLKWPRPWRTIVVLKEKDVAINLFSAAVVYAAFYAVMATIPTLFAPIYGLNETQTGLCYLPLGTGTCIAAILSGKLLDKSYARVALANNFPVDRKRGQDLRNFPIEKARLQLTLPMLAPGLLSILCYGWALEYSRHKAAMAGPLVLQFIIGMSVVSSSNCLGTLLVDLFPQATATVTATSNLTRCLLGAVATAVVNPMVQAMGLGWCYTLWALLCVLSSALLLVELRLGPRWREERRVRLEKKKKETEERERAKKGETGS